MNMHFRILILLSLMTAALYAQVPNLVSYQGRIAVGNVNFEGTGQFKFALVNAAGTTTFWSNNGTSTAGSEPTAAVTLAVNKGLYSVLLGDTSLANMTAIPSSVWTNADVRLRVWFNDGTNGSQLLTPDQRVAPNGYLPDGSVTSAKLASNLMLAGTVTAERLISANAEPPANVFPVNGMVWIKPGTFIMGSRVDEVGHVTNEQPQMTVTFTKGFWMAAHEVTQGEYLAVTGNNPSVFTGDLNRPVESVSWDSAVSYCTSLTNTERASGRLPAGWGYRLPSEAEWEYCCRAGARTTRFCYGDDLSAAVFGNYGWITTNSSSTTHPVEQKLGNPWGLMDMHGNVFEWCLDYNGTYPGGNVIDPVNLTPSDRRIVRGGSWRRTSTDCRSAARSVAIQNWFSDHIGFRIVLSSGQP